MATQRYSVTPHPIETLLTWVKSGEIAIPEIQRPFVWEATKVRNLLDSLYQGYPIGYLIAWRNPTVMIWSSKNGHRVKQFFQKGVPFKIIRGKVSQGRMETLAVI